MKLTKEQGKRLIELARSALESAFKKVDMDIDVQKLDFLTESRGVFVILKKKGELRGCIGYPEPILPLGVALLKAARSAAFEDPRFPPLEEEELKNIKIEVTVLTKPEKIKDSKQIKIGEDGLIIRKGINSGLLLPQVAVEYKWSVKEFLEQTSLKAGLDKDAWKDAEIYAFQGEIIKE